MRIGAPPLVRVYRDAFSGLPAEVWLLALVMLVNRAGMMVLPFLTLYLTQQLHFSATEAGQILGLFGVGSMAGSWLGGWISDRADPNRVQALALVLAGLLLFVLGQMRSFAHLAVIITFTAIAGDAFRPALFVSAMRYSPPQVRPRTFAVIRLAASVGMSVGPAVGGMLAAHHYQWLFWTDGGTCILAALVMLVTLGSAKRSTARPRPVFTDAPRQPWRDGPFLLFLLATLMLAMVFFQLFSTWPLHLKEVYALSEKDIGRILGVSALIVAGLEILVVRVIEDRDHMRIIGFGSFLVCLGMGGIVLGPPALFAMLSMVTWTTGEMLALPMTGAIVANRAGDASQGRYMGAFTFTFSTALVLAPMAGTLVYERLGPNVLWYGIMALGVPLGAGFASFSARLGPPRSVDTSSNDVCERTAS
jgi:predicted MFS family arabinose efflux permease